MSLREDSDDSGNFSSDFMEALSNLTSSNASSSSTTASSSVRLAPPLMPLPADVAWTVAFTVMIACAIGGNAVVFWIVTGQTLHVNSESRLWFHRYVL